MRFKSLILGAFIVAGGMQAAHAADVTVVDGNSTDDILNLMRGYGSATLGKQDDGTPKVYGKIEGQPYTIYFSSCDDKTHTDCQDLDFYAGYLGVKPSLDKINSWNRDKRFARAYLDSDGDAAIDMDVNTEHGVTSDNMDSTLGLWVQLVKKFTAYVGTK